MAKLTIKGRVFGEGKPLTCIPITDAKADDIVATFAEYDKMPCDAVEWRMDAFENVHDQDAVAEIFDRTVDYLEDKILICTYRTPSDGGTNPIDKDEYFDLCELAAEYGADIVDMEMNAGPRAVKEEIEVIHDFGTLVVCSYHDFKKTPPMDDLVDRMKRMQNTGADIVKIAVMPENKHDVDVLMGATFQMKEKFAKVPLITMSMGGLGRDSRIKGEEFGSSLTFGCVKDASAPGQVELNELNSLLDEVHAQIEELGI